MASYDEQITRLDRDGCCRPSPAYFKERQLTKRVAVAECGQRDVTIFGRDKYLDAPADDDKHLIAWVTRHKQRGTVWIHFHAAASGKTLYGRWFERGEQRCRRQEGADVHHILHRQ